MEMTWHILNWHDFFTFTLIGGLGFWLSLLALALVQRLRGDALRTWLVHQAWIGYCRFAGIGLGMTLAIRGFDEDLTILSQFFFMFAWPFAFIRLGSRALMGLEADPGEGPTRRAGGLVPDRRHGWELLRWMLVAFVVTLVAWWYIRGGPITSLFVASAHDEAVVGTRIGEESGANT